MSNIYLSNIWGALHNVISFLNSQGYISIEKGTHATSKQIYGAYCKWCDDNLDTPISSKLFGRRLKERSDYFGLVYNKNIPIDGGKRARGYENIYVKVRTDDYRNY